MIHHRARPVLAVAALTALVASCTPAASPSSQPPTAIPPGASATSPSTPGTAAASGLAGAPQAPNPPPRVALRFGLNTVSAGVAPLWVTKDEGFFDRYGIDAELAPLPGAELIVSSLLSGELAFSSLAAPALLNAAVGGADLVFVGSYDNKLRFWFYGRPELRSIEEVRDKRVAIAGRGGIVNRATKLALERNGLDPERDVSYVTTGNMANSYAALVSGNAAATMLAPPQLFQAQDEGMRLLVDVSEYNQPTILQGFATARPWVSRNEDLARRLMQAIGEGLAFTHQNKERTKQVIAKWLQSDDMVLIDRTYDTLAPVWERIPYAPPEAIRADLEAVAEENPAARGARPEQFVDNRIVEQLDREGFFQRLCR